MLAPASGRVVSAVDGIEDQVRYGPLYGNHVVIDTGWETVTLTAATAANRTCT